MRVGLGYDVHRLVQGRRLIVGGVTIDHPKGLLGHSDADVLVHAICDALLGAAGWGDIGKHFPDTDPRYKDADSLDLLREIAGMLKEGGFTVGNVDATIMAEAPKMAPHRREMVSNIANALEISPAVVNVKATTTEGLGFIGSGGGMAAMAIAGLHGGPSPGGGSP